MKIKAGEWLNLSNETKQTILNLCIKKIASGNSLSFKY